ncbi:MAG: hypothetical protein HYZ28_13215 [Myxococcales bacterium]|nr:hypothetical protein [Myxococcales bacterium]
MADSETPLAYQPYLDELTAFATVEGKKADLLEAKAEYWRLTGETFEDDKQFEMRMACFLDFYLFDRASPPANKSPAQAYYEEQLRRGPPEQANAFRSFTETLHGLFEVRKLGRGMVRLRELFSAKDHEVTERRQLAGLEKGDILEARLIPFGGHLLFSVAFCCHPKAAYKAIRAEVKRRKKAEPNRMPKELVWDCAKRALKTERYRQIAVEKIYDFENKTI